MIRLYRFFSPPAAGAGLSVSGVGRLRITKERWPTGKRVMGDYALSWVLKGTARFESPATPPLAVRAGEAILFFPGEAYSWIPEDRRAWEEWWCQFNGPAVRTLENEGEIARSRPLFQPQNQAIFRGLFNDIFRLSRMERSAGLRRLPGKVFCLLNELVISPLRQPHPAPDSAPVHKISRLIKGAPEKSWNFQALARQHGISYPLLFKEFRRHFQLPPHRFLTLQRMTLAANLLTRGHSVTETCFFVGLKDPYHFSRLFKKVMGRSPKAARGGFRGASARGVV